MREIFDFSRALAYNTPMTRETSVSILGFFVIIVPFLGFPRNVKDWIFMVLGALVVCIGIGLRYTRYRRSLPISGGEMQSASFVESSRSLKRTKDRDAVIDEVTEETI